MKKDQHHHSTSLLTKSKDIQFLPKLLPIQENFDLQIASWLNKFNSKQLSHENKL